jgi:Dipeptidyl aminopeptidases/acylaminoacyl-peptidases
VLIATQKAPLWGYHPAQLRAAAAAVRCPVLVITGARDIMAPPRNAEALTAALREPKLVSLSRSGHALTAEEPDAVLDSLRAFL